MDHILTTRRTPSLKLHSSCVASIASVFFAMAGRELAKLIVTGAQVFTKALWRSVQKEMNNASARASAQRAASAGAEHEGASANKERVRQATAANAKHGISLQESIKILNVDVILTPEEVERKFKHLFEVNDKAKGGSLYLQSKVVRAKERIDSELGVDSAAAHDDDAQEQQPQPQAESTDSPASSDTSAKAAGTTDSDSSTSSSTQSRQKQQSAGSG